MLDPVDDIRIGRIARVLRQRLRLRQEDVGRRAGLSRDPIQRLERGLLDGLTIRTVRRVFKVFDADVAIVIRWRGGELDRLVDRRHVALGGSTVELLEPRAWGMTPEVSFSEYGERGSIDLLAWHPASRCLLVVEVKTELTSIEEAVRRHDIKTRLAPKIARERFGWDVATVSRLLVLPADRTARRQVARHDAVLGRAYPVRSWAVRRWLASPSGTVAGLLFVPSADGTNAGRGAGAVRRVRVAGETSKATDSGTGASQTSR
jgi:transcriptional regulator with XRE-family HTH domain